MSPPAGRATGVPSLVRPAPPVLRLPLLLVLATLLALPPLTACRSSSRDGGAMSQAEESRSGGEPAGESTGESTGEPADSSAAAPRRDINDVLAAHAPQLMAMPGVTGVAVSQTADGAPCIMILVRELTAAQRRALPERIEGWPTCPFESGEIRPMGGE